MKSMSVNFGARITVPRSPVNIICMRWPIYEIFYLDDHFFYERDEKMWKTENKKKYDRPFVKYKL